MSVSVSASTASRFGFWNPLQSISVSLFPRGMYVAMHFAAAGKFSFVWNAANN
jgi:hypothetical protein